MQFTGIPCIAREVFLRKKATIVVYHSPEIELFKKHIEYLYKRYNFISLNTLINAINSKGWSSIPAKSLVVTIDDGNKDNYKLLEILKEYKIVPTIYLCSHIVNTNRHFWWKTGHLRLQELKGLPHDQMLTSLQDQVGYEPEKEYQNRQALNYVEILEMSPYVEFGSHTKFHPVLTTCSDEKSRDEIVNSKKYLEQLLGKPFEDFCFPNGGYTYREIEYVKESGYRSARTLDVGWNNITSDPYKLKVIEIQDNASLNVLCAQIIGLFPFIRELLHKSRRIIKSILNDSLTKSRNKV